MDHILYHPSWGVYLGRMYDTLLWSSLSPYAPQIHAAPCWQDEMAARDWLAAVAAGTHIEAGDDAIALEDIRLVPVSRDLSNFASVNACVAAGIAPWTAYDPDAPLPRDIFPLPLDLTDEMAL